MEANNQSFSFEEFFTDADSTISGINGQFERDGEFDYKRWMNDIRVESLVEYTSQLNILLDLRNTKRFSTFKRVSLKLMNALLKMEGLTKNHEYIATKTALLKSNMLFGYLHCTRKAMFNKRKKPNIETYPHAAFETWPIFVSSRLFPRDQDRFRDVEDCIIRSISECLSGIAGYHFGGLTGSEMSSNRKDASYFEGYNLGMQLLEDIHISRAVLDAIHKDWRYPLNQINKGESEERDYLLGLVHSINQSLPSRTLYDFCTSCRC
jgi:hypothetical protein